MLRYWVWLSQAAGIGPLTCQRLLEQFSSPEAIYFADETALRVAGLTAREAEGLLDKDLRPADLILQRCYDGDIRLLTLQDSAYPEYLRQIPDPPPVLYCRGRLPELSNRATLGIVGARDASAYGLTCARRLGYQVGRCGGIVVTGLARGIDTEAARGALMADAPVIGVLGCGVDVVYPARNRFLFLDVLQKGCILSEFPPQTPPLAPHFPRRNRIISGLSDGVIIVEAAEISGALLTAEHALAQGRDVFVVPGTIDNPACAGSNHLLRTGAIPVTCGWDAVQEYEHRYPETVIEFRGGPKPAPEEALPMVASDVTLPRAEERKPERPIDIEPLREKVKPEEYAILQLLDNGERQLDELIAASNLPAAKALSSVTILEVRGYIKRLPGKRFRLASQ